MIENGDEQLNDDSRDDEKLETVGKIDLPDPIDDWLSTLGGEGIEMVDSASQVKEPDKSAPGEVVPEEEAEPEPVRPPRRKRKRTTTPRPTIRCACTCARWARCRC